MEINFKFKNKCGIYSILNLENGKRYIGSSKDIYNRLHEHLYNLKNNKAHNKHLQAAWNKYGEECFQFNVLEYCIEEEQFNREQYYLDFMQPEYNFDKLVIANTGHSPTDETRKKISETLKSKYASGEITTYRQDHNWKSVYIYNVKTFKLEAECNCIADALRLLYNNSKVNFREWSLIKDTYTISFTKYETLDKLTNAIYKNVMFVNNKYIISDNNGFIKYHRTLIGCAKDIQSSKSTLSKHSNATIDNPYIVKKSGIKFYYSPIYINVEREAVPIEESSELLLGNIGEKLKLESRD